MCGNEDRTGVWGADPRCQDKRRQRGSVQRTTTFPNFYPDEVHPTLLNRHPLCFYSCNQFAGCTGLSKVQGESHFILLHTAFQISSTKSSLLIGNNVPITQVTKTAISYSMGAASGWETCVMSGPLGHCHLALPFIVLTAASGFPQHWERGKGGRVPYPFFFPPSPFSDTMVIGGWRSSNIILSSTHF